LLVAPRCTSTKLQRHTPGVKQAATRRRSRTRASHPQLRAHALAAAPVRHDKVGKGSRGARGRRRSGRRTARAGLPRASATPCRSSRTRAGFLRSPSLGSGGQAAAARCPYTPALGSCPQQHTRPHHTHQTPSARSAFLSIRCLFVFRKRIIILLAKTPGTREGGGVRAGAGGRGRAGRSGNQGATTWHMPRRLYSYTRTYTASGRRAAGGGRRARARERPHLPSST
jgi:hypothetical protein